MEKRVFRVQGSADEPYTVEFRKDGDNLSAYCNCPAGENGQYCKHRFRILGGKADGVVKGTVDQVAEVASWLEGTDVQATMLEVERLEREAERVKRALSAAKRQLAAAMRD